MPQNWKTVRVFVSSTFRDMQTERDHLVRVIFPELKERCLKRHVRLIDVDLRWGVTEKQADGVGALDICLDTIDSCRPYFLGLLGQRYGTIPNGQTDSITAQEIYHGVLHDNLPRQLADLRPFIKGSLEERELDKKQVDCLTRCYQWNQEKNKYLLKEEITSEEVKKLRSIFYGYSIYQKDRSFFYFRSESLTRDLADSNIDNFFETDKALKDKLEELKHKIKKEKLPCFPYNDIETFGQHVLETLWKRISAEFPEKREESKRDWLKEEAEFHELFMADRTRWFVGRTNILKKMHTFVEDDPDSRVIAITGEPGCGKSALVAKFTEQTTHNHPDWLILPHFVGASPSSTNLRQTLKRLCAELNRALGLTEEIPEEYKKLVQLFPELLEKAAKTRRTLLIVDALNQFEQADNAHAMRWLPQQPPINVKVVISTLAGEALNALKAWHVQPRFEKLSGLTAPETEKFVDSYLKEIQKKFPTFDIRRVFFDKIKAGHPLYILVALEELRVFPVYKEMKKRVDSLPETVPEIFDQVLERIEQDFSRSLVEEFMSFIACGRQGMTGEELQELLGKYAPVVGAEGIAPKLPDMLFSRLRRAFSAYLFERSGVIDFFHGQLKEAVGTRYLQAESDRLKVHHIIASYFERRWREPYLRAVNELPHQLTKAKEWDSVERVLCDLHFVETKCAAGLTYDLLHDYDVALDALPEAKEEMDEKLEQEGRLKKYTEDLIAYAKGEINRLEIIRSVEPWSEEKIRQDTERIISNPTRLDKIRAFSQFVNSESHALLKFASYPGFTVQQAYNSVANGPVADAAEAIANIDADHVLLLYPSFQRLEYTPYPALLRTLEEHTDAVANVCITPDGKTAISGSWDATLRVWNIKTGECTKTLQGHKRSIWCVSMTPDGKTAISGSVDKTLRVWNLETGECTKTLQGHTDAVANVCITPDGKTAISGSWDATLRVWNIKTGECTKTLQHGDKVDSCLSVTADGKTAISASTNKPLRVWNLETGECTKTLTGHASWVLCVCLTPDGKTAISGGRDKTLRVWNIKTGECTKILKGCRGRVSHVCITPDGKTAFTSEAGGIWEDSTLRVWNVERGKCTKTLYGHVVSQTGKIKGGDDLYLTCVSMTPDGKTAISGSNDITLKVWNLEGNESVKKPERKKRIRCLSVMLDGKTAISASDDNTLRIWNLKTGECTKTLQGHKRSVNCLSMAPDGKTAISASLDNTLRIWNLKTGECTKTIHTFGIVDCLSMAPDGKTAISGSNQQTLDLWDLESGEATKTLKGHTGRVFYGCVYCVNMAPDGKTAISASDDNTLRIWNLKTGECTKTIQQSVNCLSMAPDGKTAISASDDNTLRIWNLKTGECTKTIQHESKIRCLSMAPDGKTVISGSFDNTLRVWNLKTGECIAIWQANRLVSNISSLFTIKNIVLETSDEVVPITIHNLVNEAPLMTPVRLWLHKDQSGLDEKESYYWDDNITVLCQWCNKRFPVPEEKLNLIKSIDQNANLPPDQSPCLELPRKAWKEPKLLLECPICHKSLRLNPFIVDNSCKQSQDDKGEQLLEKGQSLANLGRYDEAIECYDKALAIIPQNALAWFYKGVYLSNLGRHDEAVKCYDKALMINLQDPDAWNYKGASLFSLNRFDEALECCKRALEINSQYASAWFIKAANEDQLGLKRDAGLSYRRFIELASAKDAKYVEIARKRLQQLGGNSLSSKGRFDRDRQDYDKAPQLKRIDAEALNNKGVHLHNLSHYEKATKCFDRALEINPKYASAWDNKGVSLHSLSRYKEALECHNKAIEINPQNAGAWYNKSCCLIDLNRYSQALKCCKIALEINPQFTLAWFIKGIVEDQLGLKRDAAASYRRLIELASPRDAKNVEIARGRLRELEKR